MTEKATLVVASRPYPGEQDALQEYVQGAMPLLMALGGVVIKRSSFTAALHGKQLFTFLLIMDFPSRQALEAMFASADYQKLIPTRDKAFAEINVAIAADLD